MVVLVVFMAAAAVASAEITPPGGPPPEGTPAAAPAKPEPKPTDRICWREQPTGSHFSRLVCASRQEIDDRQRRDREALERKPRNAPSGFTPR
jgi:hypothetical protein